LIYNHLPNNTFASEVEAIVDLVEFLRTEAEVSASDHRACVVEDFGQFDECHLGLCARLLDHTPAECLAEGMGAEMVDFEAVASLNVLEKAVNLLNRVDGPLAAQEGLLGPILDAKGVVAVEDMLAIVLVDLDGASLARLGLVEGDGLTIEELAPSQFPKVGYAKAEEGSASDKEGHPIVPVTVQFLNKGEHTVPR
jgi:hypothetical protein